MTVEKKNVFSRRRKVEIDGDAEWTGKVFNFQTIAAATGNETSDGRPMVGRH